MSKVDVDLFAGAAGSSTGILLATGHSPHIAVDFDAEMFEFHKVNHPDTEHVLADIQTLDPHTVLRGRKIRILSASPPCTNFSRAKAGKVKDEGVRNLAERVLTWIDAGDPDFVVVENVPEMAKWGPLNEDGTVDKDREGESFDRWIESIINYGYHVQWRNIRACDLGVPTLRKRLFILASKGDIAWPKATHGEGLKPFASAASCIDWTIPVRSIFERKKPLSDKTLARVARGIKKFVLVPEPFVVHVTHGGDRAPHPVSEPLTTVTCAHRGEHALVAPVMSRGHVHGQDTDGSAGDQPLHTVTKTDEHIVIAPTLVQSGYGEREGQVPRTLDLSQPLGTLVASGQKHALVHALMAEHVGFVSKQFGGKHPPIGSDLNQPLGTVTTIDHNALVDVVAEPAFISVAHGTTTGSDATAPLGSPTTSGHHHSVVRARLQEVQDFLIHYYGASVGSSTEAPLGAVTTKDRFGLVTLAGVEHVIVDIGMRLLEPRELARAQGFPDWYVLERRTDGTPTTKTSRTKAVGNSVCPPVMAAILIANGYGVDKSEMVE